MFLGELNISVSASAKDTGENAGRVIESTLIELQRTKAEIRIIFAAAPSQDYMLDYLAKSTEIDWSKIIAFNMDEYIGLERDSKQLFSNYLEGRLFSKVRPKEKHYIDPSSSIDAEITRVSHLISEKPIDIVCLGIGQNGHLAFNDPPVADFDDQYIIKQVELDDSCRQQQVIDKCFDKIQDVPSHALTLTIPTLMKANKLFCVVVGEHKLEAVQHTLSSEISTLWPSTILRQHPDCQFFFDKKAFGEVN